MENLAYPVREKNIAESSYKGVSYKFRVPPATGTHPECFGQLNSEPSVKVAQGLELAVYAASALDPKRQNEWLNPDLITFPSQNYLRVPAVLTIVPKRKEFGALEGGMLVEPDLKGEGRVMDTEVPQDLHGWTINNSGIFVKGRRIFIPYDKWYAEEWDENNGAAIALFTREGAELLVRARVDSKRNYAPLWKVDVNNIKTPEKKVPALYGFSDGQLNLSCNHDGGGGDGCAVRVLK